jgi:peroxiredoxin
MIKRVITGFLLTLICVNSLVVKADSTAKIDNFQAVRISNKRANVRVIANQKVQAQIEYGKNTKYGKFSAKENSFKYANHLLTLKNLSPQTTYHYRVHIWGKNGKVITSSDKKFTTALKPIFFHRDFVIKVGDIAPDFTLKFLDKKRQPVKLSSLRGKVVLLQFTASWCGVCRREMPVLEKEVWQKFKNDDFIIIGIDRGEPAAKMRALIKRTGITYPLAMDLNSDIFHLYAKKNAGITRNVLIDKTGKIVFLTRLYRRDEFEAMVKKIESLLYLCGGLNGGC